MLVSPDVRQRLIYGQLERVWQLRAGGIPQWRSRSRMLWVRRNPPRAPATRQSPARGGAFGFGSGFPNLTRAIPHSPGVSRGVPNWRRANSRSLATSRGSARRRGSPRSGGARFRFSVSLSGGASGRAQCDPPVNFRTSGHLWATSIILDISRGGRGRFGAQQTPPPTIFINTPAPSFPYFLPFLP